MKKIVTIILLVCLIPLSSYAQRNEGPIKKVMAVVDDFRSYDDFESIKIGSLGTALLKSAGKVAVMSEDKDVRQAIALLNGVKSLTVVEYEDCSDSVKKNFTRRIENVLADFETIFEAKDEGDVVHMYGLLDEKSSKLSDIIIYTPSDCALICILGTLSIDKAMELATAE